MHVGFDNLQCPLTGVSRSLYTYLQVEYLKNSDSYGQSYYRTLIGNHTQSTFQ